MSEFIPEEMRVVLWEEWKDYTDLELEEIAIDLWCFSDLILDPYFTKRGD